MQSLSCLVTCEDFENLGELEFTAIELPYFPYLNINIASLFLRSSKVYFL